MSIDFFPNGILERIFAYIANRDNCLPESPHFKTGLQEISDRIKKLHDKIRYQKHKRCLAMAELCCERKENCYNIGLRKYTKSEADFLVKKSEFWEEWEDTWTQLAYRLKEAANERTERV